MAMNCDNETVTISLERYEELKDIKNKYENDVRSELENKCEILNVKNEQYALDNRWLANRYKNELKEYIIGNIKGFVNRLLTKKNIFGFISEGIIQSVKCDYIKDIDGNDAHIILMEEHPRRDKYDVPLYKNITDSVPNSDFVILQKDIDNLIYKFMQTHDIPNGESLNYSIDSLQYLKQEGVESPVSDRYLGILDKDNNEIIASM
jgi:hypothetical protein